MDLSNIYKNYNMYMPNKNKNNTKHQFETIFLQADKLEVSYLESRNLQKVSN